MIRIKIFTKNNRPSIIGKIVGFYTKIIKKTIYSDMKHNFLLILFTFGLLFSSVVSAQKNLTIEDLKKQRKEIQARINATNILLRKTRESESEVLKKLNILKRNLSERRKLINNYNSEINTLNKEINTLTNERAELEKQLEVLKQDYARLIQKTQSNRSSYSKLMFLLSAKNFDQTVRRIRYLQEFTNYKKQQVRKIELVREKIVQKTDSLDVHKQSKTVALKAKQLETEKLQEEEKIEKILLGGIQKEEKTLEKQFAKDRSKRAQIDNKIQQVIEEEIRKAEAKRKAAEAKKRAEAEAKRKAEERKLAKARAAEAKKRAEKKAKKKTDTKTSTTKGEKTKTTKPKETVPKTVKKTVDPTDPLMGMTPEEKNLSGGFANNRGKLPWPVDRGFISGKYGKQKHPIFKHVEVNNKGIYFRSPSGTNARAVFEGVVTRRFSLPGSGNAVIIQHGNYRTVYGNLTSVYVREGDRVKAKQPIGEIYVDGATGEAELQFQIWSGSTMINPEGWITR